MRCWCICCGASTVCMRTVCTDWGPKSPFYGIQKHSRGILRKSSIIRVTDGEFLLQFVYLQSDCGTLHNIGLRADGSASNVSA